MVDPAITSRRDFLQGKSAVQALADAANALAGPAEPLPMPAAEGYLLRLSRQAMACQFEVFLNAGQYPHDSELACAGLDLVDEIEAQLSIYRESSAVSELNREAAQRPVTVDADLFGLLTQAVELSRQTQGAFDITAGPLARVWGFVRRSGAMPAAEDLAAARAAVGSRHVLLDSADQTVRFLRPEVEINLGSIGKGYALDRCAELLAAGGVNDFLLHGGNSSVLARGACVEPGHDNGWTVGLRNPYRPQQHLGKLRLRNRALATSGSGTQFFMHEGQRFGHLLDPRTGWPGVGVLSATAIAPTAALADALSTAFYLLGPEGTGKFCTEHPEVASILLCPGSRHASVEPHVFGLADGDFSS